MEKNTNQEKQINRDVSKSAHDRIWWLDKWDNSTDGILPMQASFLNETLFQLHALCQKRF